MSIAQMQKRSWLLPLSVWTIFNIFGLLLINGLFFELLSQIPLIKNAMENGLYFFVTAFYFLFAGLIFAILQTRFVSYYKFSRSPLLWFLATWISISFIVYFNFMIFPPYVYPMIQRILNHSASYFLQMGGITIYSESFSQTVVLALIYGSILGLVSGVTLGFMQSIFIENSQSARKWMVATIISFLLCNIMISIGYSSLSYFIPITSKVQKIGIVILGLSYSLSTMIPVIKNAKLVDLEGWVRS